MDTKPTLDEMREAQERLRGIALHTPLVPLHSYGESDNILLKMEIHQPVTSFKIRGVFNAVTSLSVDQRQNGLSTVSAGNTAQALAWAGRYYGVSARSIMPDTAPQTKIDAVKAYGGTPVLVPVDEVFRFLREHGWESELHAFIHPWTNRDVMIGHASAGLEIVADNPNVETVYIPVGGGGFISGVGSALRAMKPSVRIIAVEPEGCPALKTSLDAGAPASVDCRTICDGVAVPYITEEMFPILQEIVDDVMLVSEDDAKATIRRLAFGNRVIVEGSAALPVAAALATPAGDRGNTVCTVTGGSIDDDKLLDILQAS